MAELLIDLFCEEIPASLQERASEDLARLLADALAPLHANLVENFYSTRRIAAIFNLDLQIPAQEISERGPRETAPEKALEGFIRKHQTTRDDLVLENGFWVLKKSVPAISAQDYIAKIFPDILWKFPWSKAMRWGNGSLFTWVRPLRHIICLLNGEIIPFSLAREHDDAHGLASSNITEGHRFLSSKAFSVKNAADWKEKLENNHVILNAFKRQSLIKEGITALAHKHHLSIVEDEGLVREVAGLVEYPVPLLGQIDKEFMDLPPEVMQVSMRVNQRYFALRYHDGKAAPYFAFVANRPFSDNGALCIAGNERVLRARFADARHFWILDRKTPLINRLNSLKSVTFHAKLGTQEERTLRIASLAQKIAQRMGLQSEEIAHAQRASLLSKTDLTTGMVGEFPELQGVMGGYYASHDGEHPSIAQAIKEHYLPRGQGDAVPTAPISIAVALADRLDILTGFFAIGETPSGSGDPYALRRASLAIIRIIRDNQLTLDLGVLLAEAASAFETHKIEQHALGELENFFKERLKVQLRQEGKRYDVLDATLSASSSHHHGQHTLFTQSLDGQIVRLLKRVDALTSMMTHEEGKNLLAAYRRAANILRIEAKKDGALHYSAFNPSLFEQEQEKQLGEALEKLATPLRNFLDSDQFTEAMRTLATLRPLMDQFFEDVTVNTEKEDLRLNRLRLLSSFCAIANLIADFSKIES